MESLIITLSLVTWISSIIISYYEGKRKGRNIGYNYGYVDCYDMYYKTPSVLIDDIKLNRDGVRSMR